MHESQTLPFLKSRPSLFSCRHKSEVAPKSDADDGSLWASEPELAWSRHRLTLTPVVTIANVRLSSIGHNWWLTMTLWGLWNRDILIFIGFIKLTLSISIDTGALYQVSIGCNSTWSGTGHLMRMGDMVSPIRVGQVPATAQVPIRSLTCRIF